MKEARASERQRKGESERGRERSQNDRLIPNRVVFLNNLNRTEHRTEYTLPPSSLGSLLMICLLKLHKAVACLGLACLGINHTSCLGHAALGWSLKVDFISRPNMASPPSSSSS